MFNNFLFEQKLNMSRLNTFFGISYFLFTFLIPNSNFGQEIVIAGQVVTLNNEVANVLVVNLNSNKSSITDSLGLFSIEVKLKDSIRFTAVQYQTKTIIISDLILLKNSLVVNLIDNIINLNEVTVTPYNLTGKIELDIDRLSIKPVITSSSLRLPNADINKMTQSERLLIEADRGKYVRLATIEDQGKLLQVLGYATLSVVINTHKIMNKVYGRTNSLQDRVTRDKNMELEREIITKFSKKTISESFDIPEPNIDGLLTYCISQNDFSELEQAGNTVVIWEYLKARSIEFKKTELLEE